MECTACAECATCIGPFIASIHREENVGLVARTGECMHLDVVVHNAQSVCSRCSASGPAQVRQPLLHRLHSPVGPSARPPSGTHHSLCRHRSLGGEAALDRACMHAASALPACRRISHSTCRSRLMAARPICVQRALAPALAMPSSTTSAVKFSACRHSCMRQDMPGQPMKTPHYISLARVAGQGLMEHMTPEP